MAKVSLGTSRKERYRNHDCYDWKLSSLGMFDFIGIPISARSWAGERGERQEEMQKGVTENVCCVNDAETLWRNLGQHRGTKTIFLFFFSPPPSLRIVVRISLLWSIESCSRQIDIVLFLSSSFSLSLSLSLPSLTKRIESFDPSEWFFRKKKNFVSIVPFVFFFSPNRENNSWTWYELRRRFAFKAPQLAV